MIAAPVLLVLGASLFVGLYQPDAAKQLDAFTDHEGRATAAFNVAISGVVLATFAIAGVATLVAARKPRLGRVGGALTVAGLFGPAYFLGMESVGLGLGDPSGRAHLSEALEEVGSTPTIVNLAGPALVIGIILLAVGTATAGVLPRWRSWALGAAALAPVGFISGFIVISVVAWLALAVAVVPLGVRTLKTSVAEGSRTD